jgi:[ribosomal protein S5]-alanine N-acetyltransferase
MLMIYNGSDVFVQFTLRSWQPDDLDCVVRFGSTPSVCAFMSDAFPDTSEKWARFLVNSIGNDDILYRVIEINGMAAGGIGVSLRLDEDGKYGELGYWLGEQFRNRGVMTRAVVTMLRMAFAAFPVDRIVALPFSHNRASHRVLEKAGFVLEKRLEKSTFKNGVELDQLLYAVSRRR